MPQRRRKFDRLILAILLLPALSVSAFGSAQQAAGKQLKWRSGRIVLSISNSLLEQRVAPDESVLRALRESIIAWESGADISLKTRDSKLQSVSPQGPKGDGVNLLTIASTPENLRLFPLQANSPAATTRVFFNTRGEITEADIVLNPYVQFSTEGVTGTYDLRAVLTHEIGHLLGLEHSPVWGSRMFDRAGKNVHTRGASQSATVTMSDLAAVRGLYGAKPDDVTCCSSVEIKAAANNASVKSGVAWLEEAASGRVVAAAFRSNDGAYVLGGVSEGKYRAFVQNRLADGRVSSGSSEINVDLAEEAIVNIGTAKATASPAVRYLGLDAQLAELPVTLTAGQSNRLWAGGSGISTVGLSPILYSAYISLDAESMRSTEYGSNVRAVNFGIRTVFDTPPGEYTLHFEFPDGGRTYLIGSISVIAN